jgi:hypothetical protein
MISQKFTQDQEYKIETIVSPYPQQPHQIQRLLYATTKLDNTKIFHYKTIPDENTANFKIKPPVKSWINNISGHYKQQH